MSKVIIAGASGMIGGLVLAHCFENMEITEITSLVRRPSGKAHPKLHEVVVKDFSRLEDYKTAFEDVDIAYYTIGVYTGAVSRDEFRKITVDYTIAFADMLREFSPQARLCFLSGSGADQTEKSRIMFAKDKGIAENYLKKHLDKVHFFRPAYIYPVTPREEPNFSYKLSRWLYPLIKRLGPNASITSEELAQAIFYVGLNGYSAQVLENKDIVDYVK